MYIAPLRPLTWLSIALFIVAAFWSIVGNLRLGNELKKNGFDRQILRGSSVFFYPFIRPKFGSPAADREAVLASLAVVIAIVAGVYMNAHLALELPAR